MPTLRKIAYSVQPDSSKRLPHIGYRYCHSSASQVSIGPSMDMSSQSPRTGRLQPSQEQQRANRKRVIDDVYREISTRLKLPEKPSKSFIVSDDVKEIWKDVNKILAVLWPWCPDEGSLKYIQEHMILLLSCLIYTDLTEWLPKFRAKLWDMNNSRWLINDDDLPLPEDKLQFLDNSAARGLFHKLQYIFKPLVIELFRKQKPQVVLKEQRLPFEERRKDVGSGGFGTIDKVIIPPGYLKNIDGRTYGEATCKKFPRPDDFLKERGNVQILKESLTKHDSILLHLGTIEHGRNHYILLDYAENGDLEQFLNGGIINEQAIPQYNYKSLFPSLHEEDLPIHLLKQCIGLAGALRWLHGNIELDDGKGNTSCVHMDLKPSNILIMRDPTSKVGKWKISDFGISVVKSEDTQEDGNVISVGDLSRIGEQSKANNTVNTRPRRHVGAYQAPEVKRLESFIDVSRLTADQKGVGRKSDVWSFGCILAEVLTFALGKTGRQFELVKEFQAYRRGRRDNDYFYEEVGHQRSSSTYLTARDPQKRFQIRPSVTEWLDDLHRRAASPQRWIDCFVGTIKRVLIVDKDNRPNARSLYNLVNHVYSHTAGSKAKTFISCSILNQSIADPGGLGPQMGQHAYDVPNISGPKSSEAGDLSASDLDVSLERTLTSDSPRSPSIDQSNDQPERLSDPGVGISAPQDQVTLNTLGSSVNSPQIQVNPSDYRRGVSNDVSDARLGSTSGCRTSQIGTIPEDNVSQDRATSTRSSKTGLSKRIIENEPCSPTSTTNTERSKTRLPRPESGQSSQYVRKSSGFDKPSRLYGLLIEPETQLVVQSKPILHKLSSASKAFSTKAVALAVNPVKHIYDVAYLVQHHVHIFEADISHSTLIARSEFALEKASKWTDIALKGNYVAVWGSTNVHICDLSSPMIRVNLPAHHNINTLKKIALSLHGIAALLCSETIFITTIEDSPIVTELPAISDQGFTDVAFNDDSTLLFAWAFGQRKDSLYVWRCDMRTVIVKAEVEAHYTKDTSSETSRTKIIPYNTYEACLVHPPSKRMFPAQTAGSLRGLNNIHTRTNQVLLPDVQTGIIFQNHSLITIEKKGMMRSPRMKEYWIEYKATHLLHKDGKDIAKLESKCDASSAMQIIPGCLNNKLGDGVIIILYNLDKTTEWIRLEASDKS
ncbi:hypothetical protein FKW77_007588 [Venturia effusa]|uniref:non-specific serine/threonine protein kinase n=1 Tax=Venturia effusa TaxID=50376 RepID=A0A517KWU7_9PEZI|nr:hypothetical protein FKW77_007588 [Venturia effusa]